MTNGWLGAVFFSKKDEHCSIFSDDNFIENYIAPTSPRAEVSIDAKVKKSPMENE